MNIRKVTTDALYRNIPLKGWESVVSAVNAFADGNTRGSQATTRHQERAVGDSMGGLGLALYVVTTRHMRGAGNEFVERLLEDAEAALVVRDMWSRHYDYDGMGAFFKTTVEIGILDREEEMFYLSIYAAYVGDKPEEGLADALGIPRSLVWSSVAVEIETEDEEHFAFDFEPLLRKLDSILNTRSITGEGVINTMRKGTKNPHSTDATVVLHRDGDVEVTVRPGSVEDRYQWEAGEATDTWTFEGSVLTGLLHESWEDGKEFDEPTILIYIRRHSKERYNRKPFYEPRDKESVLALTESIARALS